MWALDFHHVDPSGKDLNVSAIKNTAFEKIIPELDKCILVCSNCHREIHYLLKLNDDYESSINLENNREKIHYRYADNFDIDKELLEKLVVYKSTRDIADDLGVSNRAVLKKRDDFGIKAPMNKQGKTQQKKFDISKEELEQLVWERSTESIARELGVSGNAITKRCKQLGIEKPGRGYWAKQYAK
jgi:transcriptional regulator of aromatic amino acid metabolism